MLTAQSHLEGFDHDHPGALSRAPDVTRDFRPLVPVSLVSNPLDIPKNDAKQSKSHI